MTATHIDTRTEKRFAPTQVLLSGGALALAALLVCVWVYLQVPWLGLTLAGNGDAAGIVVEKVDASGPSHAKLKPGDLIVAFESTAGERVDVDRVTISPEGGYGLGTLAQYQDFFSAHRKLYAALQQERVDAILQNGERISLAPGHRDIARIPVLFWIGCFCGVAAWLVGLGVWSFRPGDTATLNFAVNGFGMFLAATGAAVINNRELTLEPFWFKTLTNLNLLGVTLAIFAFAMLLYYYPRRLAPFPLAKVMYAVAFIVFGLGVSEVVPYPSAFFSVPVIFAVLGILLPAGAMQWRLSRGNLVDRAAISWLLLILASGYGISLVSNLIPLMVSGDTIISTSILYLLLLGFYIAIAFGVIRYRLFNLGRWWFEAMLWVVGGLMVLVFDVFLLWINAGAGISLGIAVALAGWLYFPVRQWLWLHFSPAARQTVEHHLPELINTLFTSHSREQLSANWQALLRRVFRPLHTSVADRHDDQPRIEQNGLVLVVPGLSDSSAILLSHGHKGRRLFSTADLRLAEAMLALVRQAAALREAEDERVRENKIRSREKELLLQDLHDGVGGIATGISLLADLTANEEASPATRDKLKTISSLARDALSEVRSFMQTLDDDEVDWMSIAADLRTAGRATLEPHNIQFEMESGIDSAAPDADSIIALNLFRIYKETLTNILKHANARSVGVKFEVRHDCMTLVVKDDGVGLQMREHDVMDESVFHRGRGLSNLKKRAARLGGAINVETDGGTRVTLVVLLPVKYADA